MHINLRFSGWQLFNFFYIYTDNSRTIVLLSHNLIRVLGYSKINQLLHELARSQENCLLIGS